MAGRIPQTQTSRPRDVKRRLRQFAAADGVGWQHGAVPKPPTGLMPETRKAWSSWFTAWFAANWDPSDVPGLRQVIRLYDQVERGEYVRATELRLGMDNYGITPKGQQDRRWVKPEKLPEAKKAEKYARLEAVGE